MKKKILIVLFTGICVVSFSQAEKGKLFTGGNFGFTLTTDDTKADTGSVRNSSVQNLTILPSVGYFLSNRIAVGVRAGINSRTEETPEAITQKKVRSMFEVSPFARYYMWKYGSGNGLFSVSGAVGLFTDVSFSARFGTEKQFIGDVIVSQKLSSTSFGISPGIFYYLTDKFSLEAKFGWLGLKSETTDHGTYKNIINSYGLNLTPDSFTFGINFVFL